jgi:hexosaminidase
LIINDLENWSNINDSFSTVDKNPNTTPLEPLSRNLSEASKLLAVAFSNKKITQVEHDKLTAVLTVLEGPFMDTELAIVMSLKKLLTYCKTNYFIQ